jgi:hypothetical protein
MTGHGGENELENLKKIDHQEALHLLNELNSVAWVRERTTPTERPPLVGEVSDNFCG